jgi:outer membrane protein TolC
MRFKLLVPLILIGWGMKELNAQELVTMDLEEAINFSIRENKELKEARIKLADANELIIERRAWGLPQISASVNFQRYLQVPKQPLPEPFVQLIQSLNPGQEVNREASFFLKNNFNPSVSLETILFDGSYFVGLQAARAYRGFVEREFQVKVKEIKDRVTDSYLPVLLLQKNEELLLANIENLSKIVEETRQLYDNGFVESLDLDRQLLSLANLEVEFEAIKTSKTIAMNGLKMAMGFPLEEDLVLKGKLEELLIANIANLVTTSNRPEIPFAESGIEMNEWNVKNFQSGYLPSLRAFGSWAQNYQGNTFQDGFWAPTTVAGVRMSIPIFDGLDKKAKIQRAKLELEKSNIQLQILKDLVAMEASNAKENIANTQRRFDQQKKNLELAERIYHTTQIKYKEGVGSSLEVNQAEQMLYDSQRNYLQSLYDLVSAGFQLKKALGY